MGDDDNVPQYTGEESAFIPTPTSANDKDAAANAAVVSAAEVDKRGNVIVVAGDEPDIRRWNPLGEYSSYTYQLSLYMITPDAYDAFIDSGRKEINILNNLDGPCAGGGAYLVAQSGGINDSTSKRPEGFEFDYYIDALRIKGAVSTAATSSPVFSYDMTFNIVEPYGFSFISNLKRATDSIIKYSTVRNIKSAALNFERQFYILGIKFLGYDKNGQPIQDTEGTFQRYFDISITDLKFKIDGRAITYNITAAPLPVKEAAYTKRGLIDKGAKNLTGSTVGEVLKNLEAKLNSDQSNYETKIKYTFSYVGDDSDSIKNAIFVSPADVQKSKWPMTKLKDQAEVNAKTETKATPDSTERVISFEVGTPIVQAISQVVTQSRYLIDSLTTVFKPSNETDNKTNDYPNVQVKMNQTIKWINISPKVTNPRWDKQRNDWVWDVTYEIKVYRTPMVVNAAYVKNIPKYYGPHKRYRYWYTGENSEILRYEQTFNNNFHNIVLAPNSQTSPNQSPVPQVGDKRTGGIKIGETNVGLEAQNTYVTSLYEPGAWASAKLEILGDPDLLADVTVAGDPNKYNPFYGPDGVTVNPMSGQIFIEIDFVEAVDYNNVTGIMDLNEKILFWPYPPSVADKIKGVCYMIRKITSSFRAGKFTQELDLVVNAYFQEIEDEKEKATRPLDNESQRFVNRANANKPTGFTEAPPVSNTTSGGDPCAVAPNQSSPLQTADDDATKKDIAIENARFNNRITPRPPQFEAVVGISEGIIGP